MPIHPSLVVQVTHHCCHRRRRDCAMTSEQAWTVSSRNTRSITNLPLQLMRPREWPLTWARRCRHCLGSMENRRHLLGPLLRGVIRLSQDTGKPHRGAPRGMFIRQPNRGMPSNRCR